MDDLYQEFAMSKFATKEDRDKAILQALADEREKASKSVKHITAQNLLLRTQLAAAQATIRRLENSTTEAWANHMREQLAAAQAEIAEMMQALEQFALIDLGQKTLPYSFALNVLTARKLISRPTNLEALHEALARECERLAESEGVEEGHSEWLIEEAAKHRARKKN